MPSQTASKPPSAHRDAARFAWRVVLPYVAVLAVACVGLDRAVERGLLFTSSVAGAYKVHRILAEPHPDEVPVVGSSRAKCCYAPSHLGVPAFNYGLNGADFDVALFFMEQALAQPGTQPLVVNVDYDWWGGRLGDPANYVASAEYPAVRALLGPAYQPVYRVPLLRHFGLFDEYVSDFLKSRLTVTEDVDQGAGLLLGQQPPARWAQLMALARAGRYDDIRLDTSRLQQLLRLVDAHPERRWVFVVAPYHPAYLEGLGDLADTEAWLAELDARPHVTLLDYARAPYADSLWFDPKHLNRAGAQRFSEELGAALAPLLDGVDA